MRGGTTGIVILVAVVASASSAAFADPAGNPGHANEAAGSGKKAAEKAAHGAALERLPAACDTLFYVDLASLAAIDRSESDLVRSRTRDALDELGTGSWSAASSAVRTTGNALEAHGVPWSDVNEVAMCGAKGDAKLITLSGDFHGKDVVSAISGGVTKPGATVSEFERDGKRYAKIVAGDRRFYAAPIANGVIGLAPDVATLEAKGPTTPQAEVQSGARNVFWLRATLPDGHAFESTLVKVPGKPTEQLLTTVVTKRAGFQESDRAYYEKLRDDWADRLRNGPLEPIASTIGGSIVTADRNHMQVQAVFKDGQLAQAIAQTSKANPERWSAVFEAPSEPQTATGGGPRTR
jgi:hypothetical protein